MRSRGTRKSAAAVSAKAETTKGGPGSVPGAAPPPAAAGSPGSRLRVMTSFMKNSESLGLRRSDPVAWSTCTTPNLSLRGRTGR